MKPGKRGRLIGGGLLLLLAGCGGGRGELSGTVTYRERPVTSGTVLVVGSDGLPHYSAIEPDSTYRVTDVPAGEVRVAVNSPDPAIPLDDDAVQAGKYEGEERPPPPPPVDRRKWFPLPANYGDPQTSGLTLRVRRGANPHDIRLE